MSFLINGVDALADIGRKLAKALPGTDAPDPTEAYSLALEYESKGNLPEMRAVLLDSLGSNSDDPDAYEPAVKLARKHGDLFLASRLERKVQGLASKRNSNPGLT